MSHKLHRDSFAYLTPLKASSEFPSEITSSNVAIKSSDADGFPDLDAWSYFLSQSERNELQYCKRWIWHEFQTDAFRYAPERAKALQVFDSARYALQVGGNGIVFLAKLNGNEWVLDWCDHRPRLNAPVWSRIAACTTTAAELTLLSERLVDTFSRGVVRIQNSALLLEHGLQATNTHIRLLLWTAGLDAILMGIKANEFCDRLINLLGGDTFVFPPDRNFHRQPTYKVFDVVKDLFELRSEIAHGKQISKKFRETTGILTVGGMSLSTPLDRYQYRQVLEECAVYLLCAALRKVLTSDLVHDVGNEKRWRNRLTNRVVIVDPAARGG
jgi:hypothetical protein